MIEHLKNLQKTPPYRSKMVPHEDFIMSAWYNRQTLKEIQEELKNRGVDISFQSISKFIKSRTRCPDPHLPKTSKSAYKLSSAKKSENAWEEISRLGKLRGQDLYNEK